MSVSELLLTGFVAFVVFGPSKLPMLARHIGLVLSAWNRYKQQFVWMYQNLVKEQTLQMNGQKALDAEKSQTLNH